MPDFARREARLALLDTFGCMIAAWDTPQTLSARNAFDSEQTASATALILGTAAHALDFDDHEVPGSTHPSAVIYGALLGLSRVTPKPKANLGFEVIVRLGEILRYDHYNADGSRPGCSGFGGKGGARFIEGVYADRDDLFSRIRTLKRQFRAAGAI